LEPGDEVFAGRQQITDVRKSMKEEGRDHHP